MRLLPLFHPAAALYTKPLLETLREDFLRIPALLELEPPDQPVVVSEPEASAASRSRAELTHNWGSFDASPSRTASFRWPGPARVVARWQLLELGLSSSPGRS